MLATVAISIHTLLPLGEKNTSVAGMALGIQWAFLDYKSQQYYTKRIQNFLSGTLGLWFIFLFTL
jgi:hypothetical protein